MDMPYMFVAATPSGGQPLGFNAIIGALPPRASASSDRKAFVLISHSAGTRNDFLLHASERAGLPRSSTDKSRGRCSHNERYQTNIKKLNILTSVVYFVTIFFE